MTYPFRIDDRLKSPQPETNQRTFMIIKRIANALRSQDWVAFAIEFTIVLLGVFLALQAGDWNQERKDRQLEQVYLSRLADEARANFEILAEHEKIFEEKVQFILNLPELSLQDSYERDPGEFMYQVDYSTYVQIPNLRAETYQELESSGRLVLLRSTQLRGAIAGLINDYKSTQPVFIEPIGDYRRLLFETLPGRSFYEYRTGTEITQTSDIISAIEDFRNDPHFEAAANAEVAYGSDALFYIRLFKQRTEDILSLLE